MCWLVEGVISEREKRRILGMIFKIKEIPQSVTKNGAPRAKARGSPGRNTRAAIVHPCPKGQGFWPRKYKRKPAGRQGGDMLIE